MAALDDFKNLLTPTAVSGSSDSPLGALPSAPATIGGQTVGARPGSTPVAPALVNFNAAQLPDAYRAGAPPNWQSIIAGNPDYMQWSLGAGERADTAASQRKAALRALAVRFGGLPAGFSDVYGDIDPNTLATASENPASENNRLLKAYSDQIEQNRRQLASRGMLQSGELGYSQDQLDFQRGNDVYDLNNQFLDAAQGSINDYAGIVAGLNAEQIDQIRAAAESVYQSGLYSDWSAGGGGGGGGDTTAPTDVTGATDSGTETLTPEQILAASVRRRGGGVNAYSI